MEQHRHNEVMIWWERYKLVKVIDSTVTDIHHILSRKMINKFNVNAPENKIQMQRSRHVGLNSLYRDKQNPRWQLETMHWIWQTALSDEVNKRILEILSIPDEQFYNPALIKENKRKKK